MNYTSTNWLLSLTIRTVYRFSMGHTAEWKICNIQTDHSPHTLRKECNTARWQDRLSCIIQSDNRSKEETQYMCFISQLFMNSHRPTICSLLSPQRSVIVCSVCGSWVPACSVIGLQFTYMEQNNFPVEQAQRRFQKATHIFEPKVK